MANTSYNPVSPSHREMEKPKTAVQQAAPLTNHVHIDQHSSQAEKLCRTDREDAPDNGIVLAHADQLRYGLEVQLRPNQTSTEERTERCSPDSAECAGHKNGQQTVIQVTAPPEQNGNLVYQRGFASRTDTDKHVQRRNTLAQVEQWVQVQKGDPPKRSVGLRPVSLNSPTCFYNHSMNDGEKKKPRVIASL